MPTRKIPLKYTSLSGSKMSKINNRSISFESKLEADYIELLEFDNDVIIYEEQPYLIEYLYNSKEHKYTPDFLVRYKNNRNVLVEIKYQKDLVKKGELLKMKFEAAKEFCKELGYEFQILTEKEIRNHYLDNVKFLNRYKNDWQNIHSPKVNYLLKILSILKTSTPSEIICACSKIKEQQAVFLYVLWYCIANKWVLCELEKPLNMNSKIWGNEFK